MLKAGMIDFSRYRFEPVIRLPETYEVYDFTTGYDPRRMRAGEFGIGKYNEKRRGMYTTELFGGTRDIHMGIDIAAPVGTPVHAFFDGEIHMVAYNSAPGDYGYTVITRHQFDGTELFALHGHLNAASIEGKFSGQVIRAGDPIAWLGSEAENGGWNPHLHFQLSYVRPLVCDMPGAVADRDRAEALRIYPDPRLVLGPLY
jgi:murein DD-endopeptidase MepM/ murein hydrolase activator NlpD